MKISKHISLFVVLVAVAIGLFSVQGKAYAQTIEEPELPEILKIEPITVIKAPEPQETTPKVEDPLNIDVLKEKKPVIQEKSEIVAEKASTLQRTTQEVKTIEEKKVSLASDVEAKKAQIEELKAKIAEKKRLAEEAEKARLEAERQLPPIPAGSLGGGGGGDVAVAPIRSVIPGNTYYAGQCTWHVKNLRPDLPNTLGNADQWYWNAQAQGVPTGLEARAGAAAPRKTGQHVVYVMEVYGDGTMLVSEMNYNYVPYAQRTFVKNQADFYYIY